MQIAKRVFSAYEIRFWKIRIDDEVNVHSFIDGRYSHVRIHVKTKAATRRALKHTLGLLLHESEIEYF